MLSANVIDIIILLIFLYSILMAFIKGFVNEVLSLVTLIAAFCVAGTFTAPLANMFTQNPSMQSVVASSSQSMGLSTAQPVSYVALGLSFAILFFATIIVGTIIKTMISGAFNAGIFSFGNRVLGALFGIMKGYLLNVCVIFILQLTPVTNSAAWQSSQYLPYFQDAIVWLNQMILPSVGILKEKLGNSIQGVGEKFQGLSNSL